MIDSIIFYGAGTKAGDLATFLADFGVNLRRFVRNNNFDDSMVFRTNIVTAPAVYSGTFPNRVLVTPATVMAGFTLWIATPNQNHADLIWALPSNLCRVQLDRATGKIIRRKPTLAAIRALTIDPVIAGSNYVFPTITDLT
jgi:hypothetical protein